jgi:hypothetical protein
VSVRTAWILDVVRTPRGKDRPGGGMGTATIIERV